jgi:3-hydroxyisobutyrate dehydrogenase-like beta-hydroxyacid dehydrogenase
MPTRLAGAGFDLTVFDINRSVQERFAAENRAIAAQSLPEVARNRELIITMLPDSQAVRAAVVGAGQEDGIAVSKDWTTPMWFAGSNNWPRFVWEIISSRKNRE